MNLSAIQRMVRSGDMSADALRYLLNCRCECEWLDFKERLPLESDYDICSFGRDTVAIRNVGGGYLVIGVRDKTWEPIGLKEQLPYDSKMIRDKIRKATGIELEVDIVHHEVQSAISTTLFAIIFVRSTRKRNKLRIPTLIGHNHCPTQPYGLRRGEIYARKGDSTVRIQSSRELEELLENLESQSDHDAMAMNGRSSPFAIEDGTFRLLEKNFDHFIGRSKLKTELLNAVTRDPRIWIINVHGPGGVGKSALVTWAVYEFYAKRTFEAIIQLTAKDTILTPTGIETFSRTLYSLENLLDHIIIAFEYTPPSNLDEKRKLATEILSAWTTLLVLDNMETVQDGRILDFIQGLPHTSKAKVLLTSRQRTGKWELPFPINELDPSEVQEFLQIRTKEMHLDFPCTESSSRKVWKATGGLPLAIQWLLGRLRLSPSIDSVIGEVSEKDSPVLEFSFRNIWQVLSADAKAILAVMSVFDQPPTVQEIAIATEFQIESIEKALSELVDVTLVNRTTQISDGRVTHVSLPITLDFARHQLAAMGDFELECRQRFQKFTDQIKLQESEIFRFRNRFDRFGLETENEKKAAILCQRGESEMFIGNIDLAEMLFKQARDAAPQSGYVYALSASYELARNRIGNALAFAEVACKRATKRTGSLCYTIKAQILEVSGDRMGRASALERAVEFDPRDAITRHQYGVALSRAGKAKEAIGQFTAIIDAEKDLVPPKPQLLMSLKTRMINLRRLNRDSEVQSDLRTVTELLRKYPHLASEAHHFSEFY